MKTDKWFYELFLSQPGMLAELMPGIHPHWEFRYSAPVIKEKEFRLDGVFTPFSDDPMVPMVFAEAQMQADEDFYARFFASIFLYLRQYRVRRVWRGLLILPNRELTLGTELPYAQLLDQQVTRLHLSELVTRSGLSPNLALLQLLVIDQERAAKLSRVLLQDAETDAEFERRLSLIETILANKFPDLTKVMIMQILDLKQMDITQSQFYQEIMTEGLEQGRQEGEVNLILRLLTRRLGALPEAQVQQIQRLLVEQLEELAEALLAFKTLGDLEVWLGQQGGSTGSTVELS